jgi:hypothetical protein
VSDGARAVSDGQGCSSGDCVSLAVMDDLGGAWAEGCVFAKNLGVGGSPCLVGRSDRLEGYRLGWSWGRVGWCGPRG